MASSSSSGSRSAGGRGVSWRAEETRALLSLWGQGAVQEELASCHRNMEVFEALARQMRARGHPRSATECRTKTKTMRRDYRRVVAARNSSRSSPGRPPATCPHYAHLHRILREGAARARPKRPARSPEEASPPAPPTEPAPAGPDRTTSHDPDALRRRGAPPPGAPAGQPGWPPGTDPLRPGGNIGSTQEPPLGEPNAGQEMQETDTSTKIETGMAQAEDIPGDGFTHDHHLAVVPAGEAEVEEEPLLLQPLVELSAETRLEKDRNRLKRVAALTDIGERMLEQGKADQEKATRLMQTMLDRDEQRFQALLEEGERDRAVFQKAMERNATAVTAAVDALRNIGDVFRDIQRTVAQQGNCQSSPLMMSPEQWMVMQRNEESNVMGFRMGD